MIYFCLACAALLCLGALTMAGAAAADDRPVVVIDTSAGPITLELDRAKAPKTVDNFLKYADSGFYNNLVFHRVIPGFMVQGGGFDDAMKQKSEGELDPIQNEAGNGLSNQRGTIAMARTNDPNSATCQFYINLVDNSRGLDRNAGSAGYTVFGKVVEGMENVDKIARVETGPKQDARGVTHDDVPVKPVYIRSVKRKGKS
jgi:cyclophilin family peptidyl-prolyl cis-trans isomerase